MSVRCFLNTNKKEPGFFNSFSLLAGTTSETNCNMQRLNHSKLREELIPTGTKNLRPNWRGAVEYTDSITADG